MKTRDIVSYSFSSIRLRKLRATLTTLGVVIGIAAIVALLSLGQGFQATITNEFQSGFATNTLIVSPRGSGALGGGATDFHLLVNDTQAIDKIGNVSASVATIQKSGYIQFGNRSLRVNIIGVDYATYSSIYSSTFVAKNGSIPLNPDDQAIVVGTRILNPWENGTLLFNVNDSAQIIMTTRSGFNLVNESYTGHVVAVLNEIGGFSVGGPSDSGVYIPIDQAQKFFNTNQTDTILVQLTKSDKATIQYVSNALKNLYSGQVTVTSPTAILDTISSIFSIIEIFLAGIAGISLLVAGIGIMNIMIVSLMERTREIGILKALGMRSRTVLLIFLSETVIIGLLGAVIGIALGWGLANIAARVGLNLSGGGLGGGAGGGAFGGAATGGLAITPVLTSTVLLGALAFGVLVSVIFGLYPAWRASKLKPVDALRYE